MTVPAWARKLGMSKNTIYGRIRKGWTVPQALGKDKPPRGSGNAIQITLDGETKSITQWAKHLGMDRQSISLRLKRGMSPEEALDTKYRKARK